MIARGWGVRDLGGIGKKVQIFSNKMNKAWGSTVKHENYTVVDYTTVYNWNFLREDNLNVLSDVLAGWGESFHNVCVYQIVLYTLNLL